MNYYYYIDGMFDEMIEDIKMIKRTTYFKK